MPARYPGNAISKAARAAAGGGFESAITIPSGGSVFSSSDYPALSMFDVADYSPIYAASTVTVFQGSTVTVDGAPIPRTYMPGSQNSGNRAVGSFREEGFVRHLLPNTDYAVKITNSGAKASATTDIHLVWYEYDNSDVTWR